MKHLFTIAVGILAIIASTATPSFAQTPKGNVAGGWQYLHSFEDDVDDVNAPKGFFVEGAGHITPVFDVIGEYAANFKSETQTISNAGVSVTATADVTLQSFMGGIRVGGPAGRQVRPFAQVLLGGIRASGEVSAAGAGITVSDSDSDTQFGVDFGGGIDFNVAENLGVRTKATYLHATGDSGGNAFRFQVGVVIPF